MAAITICSDFGAPKNKVSHCFPIYLPWSDGTGCHYLSFLNVRGDEILLNSNTSRTTQAFELFLKDLSFLGRPVFKIQPTNVQINFWFKIFCRIHSLLDHQKNGCFHHHKKLPVSVQWRTNKIEQMNNAWRWSTQLDSSNIILRHKDKLPRERVESPFLVIIEKRLYL